jgi:hypothetical protein
MASRQFRSDESVAGEKGTRDAVALMLAQHGFEILADERTIRGTAVTQVIMARRGSDNPIRMHVRLCWRRRGRNPREESYSAAQLRASLIEGDWDRTLAFVVERAAINGTTHTLFVQDGQSGIAFAALVPTDQIPGIWQRQREVSADLIRRGATGRWHKNHAENGSSPTIWLQDDRWPTTHAVADVLWQWPGVLNVLAQPMAADNAAVGSVRIASMLALVRALAAHGGYATPGQTYDWIKRNTDLPDRMPTETKLPSSAHFEREVRFARQELADAGLLASTEGAWRLLDAAAADLTPDDARRITQDNTRRRRAGQTKGEFVPETTPPPHSGQQPTTGPRPASWEQLIKREIGPASVYVLRFAESAVWKIGFAGDVEARLRDVNRHIPVELLGQRWTLIRTKLWPSSDMAYQMEQRILEILTAKRTVYERVQCPEPIVEEAWQRALVDMVGEADTY